MRDHEEDSYRLHFSGILRILRHSVNISMLSESHQGSQSVHKHVSLKRLEFAVNFAIHRIILVENMIWRFFLGKLGRQSDL